MQVTGITAAYTGTQAQRDFTAGLFTRQESEEQPDFESYLLNDTPAIATDEALNEAVERAVARLEILVGKELAEDVVNQDGSINLAQLAQLMSAANTPYGATDRVTFANTPQVVNLIT